MILFDADQQVYSSIDWDSSQTAVTAYLNQALYTIRAGGRAGEFPVGETNRSQTATDVVMVIT